MEILSWFIYWQTLFSVSVILMTMVLVRTTASDGESDDESDVCADQLTCSACIKLPHCLYCIDANFTKEMPRCMLR